nr:ribbon-helix-helix domain-containing protein [Marinicella sp. W31]MDC2876957.1 ribbon-helix-helix domain-containing protein [Marinicella sp. W31]
MCRLFIEADPEQWDSTTRSIRIDGMVTSVRLENFFWHVLADISARDGLNTTQLIAKLFHEAIEAGHDSGNFTSFLRVCCGRYLSLQLAGEIPGGLPIAKLDAGRILEREKGRRKAVA